MRSVRAASDNPYGAPASIRSYSDPNFWKVPCAAGGTKSSRRCWLVMRGILPNSSRTTEHRSGSSWFSRMANATASWTGRPIAFLTALAVVLIWGVTGPIFQYSDTWQLVINTGTTIVTFLMVFLIQNTQNRDTMALHVNMDELIRALDGAHNALLDLEERDAGELAKKRLPSRKNAEKARA